MHVAPPSRNPRDLVTLWPPIRLRWIVLRHQTKHTFDTLLPHIISTVSPLSFSIYKQSRLTAIIMLVCVRARTPLAEVFTHW